MDLTDIYRMFHPTSAQYIFFFGKRCSPCIFFQNRSYLRAQSNSQKIEIPAFFLIAMH
jgi:hypothetical protein